MDDLFSTASSTDSSWGSLRLFARARGPCGPRCRFLFPGPNSTSEAASRITGGVELGRLVGGCVVGATPPPVKNNNADQLLRLFFNDILKCLSSQFLSGSNAKWRKFLHLGTGHLSHSCTLSSVYKLLSSSIFSVFLIIKTGTFSVSMPYLMSFTIFRSQKYQSKFTGQSRPFCLFCFGIEPQWAQLAGVYRKLQISQSPWPLVLCSYLVRHWPGHKPKLKNGYNYTNLIKRTNHTKWSKLITLQRPRQHYIFNSNYSYWQ